MNGDDYQLTDADKLADDLSIAASLGQYEAVHKLLKNGVSLGHYDYRGWFALHWACQEGHSDIVRLLIDSGADVNAKSIEEGITPLMQGHIEVVQILLEHGADPSVDAPLGGLCTSVQAAEKDGHVEILEMLREAIEKRQK